MTRDTITDIIGHSIAMYEDVVKVENTETIKGIKAKPPGMISQESDVREDIFRHQTARQKILDIIKATTDLEYHLTQTLYLAHDRAGHWGKDATLARLRGHCYWPNQSDDVEKYVASCYSCGLHAPSIRSQLLHPIHCYAPNQIHGMDWIGPLPVTPQAQYPP